MADRADSLREGGCACFNFRRASRAITQVFDEAMRPTGYKASQIMLLGGVRMLAPVTIGVLADKAVMDRTTLTRNIKPLERDGLIRVDAGQDRRERVISLSPKGEKVLGSALALREQAQQRVAELFGKRRLGRLIGDVAELVEAVR